jgi:hypothetical protein
MRRRYRHRLFVPPSPIRDGRLGRPVGLAVRPARQQSAARLAGVGSVPRVIEKVVGRYLDAVDRELPGLVTGLYLVGSVALGAWQPGASDVDTVILTSRVPEAGAVSYPRFRGASQT